MILIAARLVIERVLHNGPWTPIPTAVVGVAYLAGTAWGAVLVYRIDPATAATATAPLRPAP